METLNVKDIQQPFTTIKDNIDDYLKKMNGEQKLPPEEMIKLLHIAQPVESTKNLYDEFSCVACFNLS